MIESQTRARPLVLVVDDDETMRLLAVEALAGSEFDVLEASDGEQGLAIFEAERPDLVILDVMMPGKSGFEVCGEIRRHPAGTHVPVLMATGLEDLAAIDQAYDAGATDFLNKPLNVRLLRYRLLYVWRNHCNLMELARSQQWLSNAQRVAKIGYFEWTVGSENLQVCSQAARIFASGKESGLASATAVAKLIPPDERAESQRILERARETGEPFRQELHLSGGSTPRVVTVEAALQVSGDRTHLVGVVQDVTDRRRAEARLKELVSFDSVTGLPNRQFFLARVAEPMSMALEAQQGLGLAVINVRNFRRVNEALGPEGGDLTLRELGARLTNVLHAHGAKAWVLGRLGGDDFGAAMTGIEGVGSADQVARAVEIALNDPIRVFGRDVYLDLRGGIALAPEDSRDPESLLRFATVASNHEVDGRRTSWRYYDESMNRRTKDRLRLEQALRAAVAKMSFELHYQPKLDATSERVVGAEALLRWKDPELGRVNPGDFIPLAESLGLIVPIGEWVLATACRDAATWPSLMSVAVNVSAQHFLVPGFVENVARVLKESGLEPSRLELEITEGVLIRDAAACRDRLAALRALGVSIALDDFGTGYSSLSYLHNLPLDVLKIDRSFVKGLPAESESLVPAIVAMAHGLGLRTVAEGVETQAQREALISMGCDELQGFYYSPARPLSELFTWVAEQARVRSVPRLEAVENELRPAVAPIKGAAG